MGARRVILLAALALVAACASTPPLTAGSGAPPLYVAVLPVEVAPGVRVRAPVTSTVRALFGAGTTEALRDGIASGIATEGYTVQAPEITADKLHTAAGTADPSDMGALARALGVDAVAHAEVLDWDASCMVTHGRVLLALAVTLYDRQGTVVWRGESTPSTVTVRLYNARRDIRAYMNVAVDSALSTLP